MGDLFQSHELEFRDVLDALAEGKGEEDVLVLGYGRDPANPDRVAEEGLVVVEWRGRLGPLTDAVHGSESHPDGYRTSARFAVGDGAINLSAADFQAAERSPLGPISIHLVGMTVEVRGLPAEE